MPRVLGVDFGMRRMGVALSDVMGITACPFKVIERQSMEKDLAEFEKMISEQDVTLIVVGKPLNMDGTDGNLINEVNSFVRKLEEKFKIQVVLVDERLTTIQAERMLTEEADITRGKRKGVRDKVAAALILQSYLDSAQNQ
jgi:putative holliday junction resolvase